jgi:hypothetical protein
MSILGGIINAFDGSGDTVIVIPATSAAAYEPYYLLSQIKTVDGSGSGLDADLLDGYHASHFGTASQIITLQNTDVSLQSQVNNLFAIGSRLVFRENFTGNGSATGFVLTGALQNAGFSVGSWSAANVLNALQVDITDFDGKPIYDSNIPIYRDRINATLVDSFGNVTLNFAPLAGQQFSIWYWYQLQAGNVLSYYYREDHVAEMEGDGVQMASQVDTDTTSWGNVVLRTTDNTVQKALNRLDLYVQSISAGNSSNDTTLRSEVAAISGSLQSQIDSISVVGSTYINVSESPTNTFTVSYTGTQPDITRAEVAAISGGLNTRVTILENAGYITSSALTPYTLTTTTASISGGLNARLTTVENNYAAKATPVAGTYNTVTVNGQGIVTAGSNADYATNTTVAAASGSLQTQIDSINILPGSNITVVQSPSKTWTISSTVSGTGNGFTPIAGTGMAITAPTTASYEFSVTDYISATTVASISGSLQSQINAITVPTSATFLTDYDNRYVNVTGDVMTGNLTMSGASIQLDVALANPTYQEGRVFYDSVEKALSYYTDINGVTVNVGQEHLIKVKNVNGSPLADGDVVYVFSADGNNVTVKKARADLATTSRATIGVVTQACADNASTYITRLGKVHGLNTNAYNEGDTVYLSSTVDGGWTTTLPPAPARTVRIGYVTKKSAGDGHLLVDVHDGLSLTEVNDVWITSAANRDLLSYNSANSRWENTSVVAATSGALDSRYTLLSTTASISGDLQSQISAITVPTSATFLSDYDNRYVNVTGDTMTGGLTITADTSGNMLTIQGSGVTNPTNVEIRGKGSVNLLLTSDTDDLTETDTPSITMSQDGGNRSVTFGINSTNEVYITPVNSPIVIGGSEVRITSVAGTNGNIVTHDANGKLLDSGILATDLATNTTVASISSALNSEILQASTRTIGFTIDGAGSTPATGAYASVVSPFGGTITNWTIISDISGSATLDVWKANGAKPTNANSIVASAKPTLTSSDFTTSSTLTGWTTSVATGDVLTVELEAISGCNRITLQLGVTV